MTIQIRIRPFVKPSAGVVDFLAEIQIGLTAAWLASRGRIPLSGRMDLATARQNIQSSMDRMRALYLKPVFDEWMILSPGAKHGGVIAYSGARVESFRGELMEDVEPLRVVAEGRQLTVGDFEFAPDAPGPRYDALMKIGDATYLICNHVAKTMTEIRADPRWLKAQTAFFDLSEKFRADPFEPELDA
jgi:hypothetical protein